MEFRQVVDRQTEKPTFIGFLLSVMIADGADTIQPGDRNCKITFNCPLERWMSLLARLALVVCLVVASHPGAFARDPGA
jgi:hypothetical protein